MSSQRNGQDELNAKVDTVDTVVDGIQTDLDNATDGLGALKTLIDAVQTDLDNGTDGLGALKTLVDALQTDLDNGTDGLGALKALIDTVDGVADGIQTDLDNGTDGLGALKALIDTVDGVVDGIHTDLGNGTDGLGALKTLIDANQTDLELIKDNSGGTFDGTTDSLEKIRDSADTGFGVVDGKLDTIDTVVDGIQTDLSNATDGLGALKALVDADVAGRVQVLNTTVTDAANKGTTTTLATVTAQDANIRSITVRANGATTGDLTHFVVSGGAASVITFIDSTDGAQANVDATDKQVTWEGLINLGATSTITILCTGTGVTAVSFDVSIRYEAATSGGSLA